jgi:hypothetical protein
MSAPRRAAQSSTQIEGMHVCPKCSSEFVQPTDWLERGSDSWAVELRCPECEWLGGGVFSQAQIDRYDEKLDDGCRSLSGDLQQLVRENMQVEIDAFTEALWSDRILPEDF